MTYVIAWKKAPLEILDHFDGNPRILQFFFLLGCPDEQLLTSIISQSDVVKCILVWNFMQYYLE